MKKTLRFSAKKMEERIKEEKNLQPLPTYAAYKLDGLEVFKSEEFSKHYVINSEGRRMYVYEKDCV